MEISEALSPIREKLTAMDERIRNIEANMVRKEPLDEKISVIKITLSEIKESLSSLRSACAK